MPRPITAKINVTRILKEHLYKGKNGTYLDLVLWPKKDGPDQYENTHSVQQDCGREAREKGVKNPFIGDAKVPGPGEVPNREPAPAAKAPAPGSEEDDVPF